MSYMFQPQTCRFLLYTPFNKIINDHLQNLAFDPINGVLLSFESPADKQRQSVTIEIDADGNVSKVSMIDPKTLSADVMFVNGIPFLTTLSRKIQLRTAEFLPSRTASQLSKSLKKVMRLYYRGGFNVRVILMDMEFVKLAD